MCDEETKKNNANIQHTFVTINECIGTFLITTDFLFVSFMRL